MVTWQINSFFQIHSECILFTLTTMQKKKLHVIWVVSITRFRILKNSLLLNSCLAVLFIRKIRSSPLSSTTLSLSSWSLILRSSSNSCSLFAIMRVINGLYLTHGANFVLPHDTLLPLKEQLLLPTLLVGCMIPKEIKMKNKQMYARELFAREHAALPVYSTCIRTYRQTYILNAIQK